MRSARSMAPGGVFWRFFTTPWVQTIKSLSSWKQNNRKPPVVLNSEIPSVSVRGLNCVSFCGTPWFAVRVSKATSFLSSSGSRAFCSEKNSSVGHGSGNWLSAAGKAIARMVCLSPTRIASVFVSNLTLKLRNTIPPLPGSGAVRPGRGPVLRPASTSLVGPAVPNPAEASRFGRDAHGGASR